MRKFIFVLLMSFLLVFAHAQTKTETKTQTPAVTSKKVKHPKTIKTASGLQYTITSQGSGQQIHRGDIIKAHYTGKLTNDTVFDTSLKRGVPFEFMVGRGRVIKGWDEAFTYLHVGDKARLVIPPDLGYGQKEMGNIPSNSTLIFEVEAVEVKPGIQFFEIKNHDTLKTASGLKYLVAKSNPTGDKPQVGGSVSVNYIGCFTDGTIFDCSADRGKPIVFQIGKKQVIPGWEEGIALMHTGEKYRLIIPYQLAYGEQGYQGIIPPKANLIFDVELVEAKAPVKVLHFDIAGKEMKTTESGLMYILISKGTGTKAESGKTVKVHYTGYLDDGSIFDSSVERGEPIEFKLGQGMVIAGWEEGITLMNVGDKMQLIIPYDLAYGESGRPPVIPPKAKLTFDVELLEVN